MDLRVGVNVHAMPIRTEAGDRMSWSARVEVGPHSLGLYWWPRGQDGLKLSRTTTRLVDGQVVQTSWKRQLLRSAT